MIEVLKEALEALEASVDTVCLEYDNEWQVLQLENHRAAITNLRDLIAKLERASTSDIDIDDGA